MTKYIEYENDDDLLQVDSSIEEVRSFVKSTLHANFQREIDIRIDSLTAMLDDPKMLYSGRDYDVFRGGKRAMIEMKSESRPPMSPSTS